MGSVHGLTRTTSVIWDQTLFRPWGVSRNVISSVPLDGGVQTKKVTFSVLPTFSSSCVQEYRPSSSTLTCVH